MANAFFKSDHGRYKYSLTVSTVGKVPKNISFKRASVIPYYVHEGMKYFALFMDSRFRELTDCGGALKDKSDFLSEALRELKEESLGIFDLSSFGDHLKTCVCYYDTERVVIFVEILKESYFKYAPKLFHRVYKKKVLEYFSGENVNMDHLENCSMCWISDDDLKELTLNKQVKNENLSPILEDINTTFKEELVSKLPKDEAGKVIVPDCCPLVETKFKKSKSSNMDYSKQRLVKSLMTPYWFYIIYICPHEGCEPVYPNIWDPVKFFLLTLYENRGCIV